MCENLKIDLNNSFILFPCEFRKSHDKISSLLKKEKLKIYDNQIKKQFDTLNRQFRYEKFGLTVIPPASLDEIINEGQKLHHCVGNYISRIVKGECIILFLRKTNMVKKPLCTVEIKGKELVQTRIFDNNPPTPEI